MKGVIYHCCIKWSPCSHQYNGGRSIDIIAAGSVASREKEGFVGVRVVYYPYNILLIPGYYTCVAWLMHSQSAYIDLVGGDNLLSCD